MREDSGRIGFRPLFIDRPRRSLGLGLDYVSSVGAHLWLGAIDRTLLNTLAEGTALLELSEVRQELELGVRRTTPFLGFTTHPTARLALAREQVRSFDGPDPLPPREVDEVRALFGFERALSWRGRYRWGLESHLWKLRDEAPVEAVGLHGQFWWLRANGTPIVTVDGDVNSRYERLLVTANKEWHFLQRYTLIPRLRVGAGHNLPLHETFSLGGYEGFPGFRVFEQRSSLQTVTTWVLKYRISGPLFLTIENAGAGVVTQDPLTGEYTPETFISGEAVGLELATPFGPVRLGYGHNTIGRKQATFTIGTWQ
jgi:hypothetical protein